MAEPYANDSTGGKIRDRTLIFVSYASPDRASAERLVSEIEGNGMPCWMAPRDVPGGANWGKAILDAIESAEIFVVLLSASANKSVHVANEIERAASYRKTIVPLRIENVMPGREIELHISARHWVDLFFRRTATEGSKYAPIPRCNSRRVSRVLCAGLRAARRYTASTGTRDRIKSP